MWALARHSFIQIRLTFWERDNEFDFIESPPAKTSKDHMKSLLHYLRYLFWMDVRLFAEFTRWYELWEWQSDEIRCHRMEDIESPHLTDHHSISSVLLWRIDDTLLSGNTVLRFNRQLPNSHFQLKKLTFWQKHLLHDQEKSTISTNKSKSFK
jgi:hypothetical protein